MPTSTEPTRGVQLKEGTFTFSQHFKCNVDVKALKEIPQKLDICQQGIEGLNDLFYEVAPDQKEGVLIQKAIWENVLERILDMRVFNATSSYTNVSNQLNPLKVILPENRQYFPIDSAFSKEPNNIFCETKRFARELLDIVVAIKTMREDNLFGFPEFHIYPTRDAFVLTDTDTGERHIAIGIYSILPAEEDENLNTEQYSIKAIRDLISQRWDKREFRQVYKADSLDKMIMHLRKLAPDLPTWKKFTLGTCKIFSYAALTFIVFSALMILNGLCPWNKAILEDINIYEISNDGMRALAPETTIVDGYKQDVNSRIRILLQSAKRSDKTYQVVGTYRSPMRLDTMGGLLIFNLLNVSTKLDRLYHLNYSEAIKHSDLNFNPELKLVTIVPVDEISLFRLEGRKNVWGRDRIQLTASKNINKVQNKSAREAVAPAEKDAKVPALDLELFVMKPQWTLEMNPKEIAFQQAEAGKESIETDLINIYANPTDAEKDKGVKIAEANLDSYFTVSFNRAGVPIQIHYLDPKGDALAKVIFDSFDEGKLKTAPKLQSVRVDTRKNRDRDEEEEEEAEIEEEDQDYDRGKSRNSAKRLPALKNIDTFWLKRNDAVAQLAQQQGDITKEQLVECLRVWRTTPSLDMQQLLIEKGFLTKAKCDDIVKKLSKSSPEALGIKVEVIKDLYYRLPAIPKDVNALKMVVLSRHLPSEEIKGNLHIAIPGIEKTISVPITFQPKQEVEFDPGQIADIRETVTGVALPIKVNKRVWGELKSYQPHEFRYFMFQLEEKADAAHLEGYPSFTVGLQLRDDPDKLYFYNPVTKETGTISDYQRRAGKIYFSAKAETYGKASSNFFEVDAKNPYLFGIRENIAKTTSNLYIMILTDKNVEESQLTLRWRSGEEAAKLPTTARSKEGLRLVHWKSDSPIKEISRYTPKDWLEEKIALRGPLGNAQFQAIIFSGEQADKDVSSDIYVNIADPKLVNILYQTVDGDWFANIDASHKNVKALVEHPSQLGKKKFGKEREQLEYFRAETKEIGRIEKFLFVPGEGVLPGQEPKTTKVTFYYPEKDMYVALDVEVSCEEALKVDSKLALDGIGNTEEKQTPAELKLTFSNYPRAKANELENDLMFLATCASTALLHAQYHSELTANSEDMRWAEAIRWSLESIGLNGPANPPSSMGQLGDTIKVAIEAKNEDGLKKSYEIMRETLLLAWSPQAQDLLSYHLGWKEIGKALREGKSFQNDNFALNIKLQPERVLPPLVNEPERFETVEFIIPCDKLVLDKVKTNVVELRESYYYNIPKNFASASSIQNVLKSIYPFEEAFPEQDKTMDSGVEVSTTYYENILKYSLWEHRLNDFRKQESKFYVAMLGVTSEIADLAGGIDEQEVNKVANEMQKQLSNYFISPLEISRVYWSEIKNKVRGNAEENRGKIGSEEQQSLLRYIERSMMSQLTDTTCWYTNFSFLIDRYTLDACPYHKDIYIKTYRPTTEGYPGESIKFRIFKRDGMQISPYPGQEYSVDVLNYGYDTHLITVKGMTVYQDWFTEHPCNEIKPTNVDKRLRIKLYYEEQGEEKELVRPGVGAPPIIDFDVHPASVILFELKGYHISPDRIRQIVRSKDFSIVTTKGNTKWNWTFSFDNGPIVVPFSYKIKKSLRDLVSYSTHILSWKQDPAAPEDERKLESLASKYDMEFLYINTQEQLPMSQFFPYTKMEDICRDYDNGRMSSNRMIDFLEKLFSSSEQIKGTIKFKWNPELTAYYKNNHDKDQMFRYAYQNSHELRVTVPAIFETPADFTGTHPALVCPPGSQMSVIWRIVPSKNTLQRGFPKYILEKKLFPSSDPVVSKE